MRDLCQSKVTSSFTAMERPGLRADNCSLLWFQVHCLSNIFHVKYSCILDIIENSLRILDSFEDKPSLCQFVSFFDCQRILATCFLQMTISLHENMPRTCFISDWVTRIFVITNSNQVSCDVPSDLISSLWVTILKIFCCWSNRCVIDMHCPS